MNELDLENFRKENNIVFGKVKKNGFIGFLQDTPEENNK